MLLLALALFFVWSLMSGSVALRAGEVLSAVLSGGGERPGGRRHLENSAASAARGHGFGRGAGVVRLSFTGVFSQPHCRPFCAGHFLRGQADGGAGPDFVLRQHRMASAAFLILAAFAGAMLSMAFVLLMARRVRGMSMLVISGMMIGYICSAITDFVVTFASDADIVNLHNWSMGSFSGMSWDNVRVMTAVVAAAG